VRGTALPSLQCHLLEFLMRPSTIRMPVVTAVLIGFVIVLALAAAQGPALLGASPFAVLFAVAVIALLLGLGLTAWDEEANAVASGGRTFACVLAGAAIGAFLLADGAGFAASCLALAVPVALLSASLDRRAWLST
jgi:hypothetical protein